MRKGPHKSQTATTTKYTTKTLYRNNQNINKNIFWKVFTCFENEILSRQGKVINKNAIRRKSRTYILLFIPKTRG